MLAGAGVPDAATARRDALEVVFGRGGATQERLDRRELARQRLVRGTGDRQLVARELGRLAGETERLERLCRGTEERHVFRVAPGALDPPVAHDDRVDAVNGFKDASPLHGYAEHVHDA